MIQEYRQLQMKYYVCQFQSKLYLQFHFVNKLEGWLVLNHHIRMKESLMKKMHHQLFHNQKQKEAQLIKVIKNISDISFSELHIVFGMSKEKKIKKILSCLPKKATYYFCQANIERSLNVMDLYLNAKKLELNGSVFKNTNTALCQAKKNANKNDLILVTGSAFIVSEVV